MAFEKIEIQNVGCNPFMVFEQSWALLTAGNESSFNMMTIAWGGLGRLWNKHVATVYVKPTRYTKEFMDASDDFTISFFPPAYHKALEICGSKSGRDINKVEASGLSPEPLGGGIAFSEANLVLVCHKLYMQDFDKKCFFDAELLQSIYPAGELHAYYVGEVTEVYGQKGHGHPTPLPNQQ